MRCREHINKILKIIYTVALKMIDVIDKKQMWDSVITGKENQMLLEGGILLCRCFWHVLMIFQRLCFFVFGYAHFMRAVNALKLLLLTFFRTSGFFWWKQVGNPVPRWASGCGWLLEDNQIPLYYRMESR